MVWSATAILESLGFMVRLFVSDGASPNRRFYHLHGDKGTLVYKTPNIFTSDKKRDIFVIADPSHLIKTTRNDLENSYGHNNTRNLHVMISCKQTFALMLIKGFKK